jgi:hypothetical protein
MERGKLRYLIQKRIVKQYLIRKRQHDWNSFEFSGTRNLSALNYVVRHIHQLANGSRCLLKLEQFSVDITAFALFWFT